MIDFKFDTVKEYVDEIERLKNEAYMFMLKKFPVGAEVEYYRGSILTKAKVMSYAKNKCTLRLQNAPGQWVYWLNAVMCEPENPIEMRTIHSGSNASKIRKRQDAGMEEKENAETPYCIGCKVFMVLNRKDDPSKGWRCPKCKEGI